MEGLEYSNIVACSSGIGGGDYAARAGTDYGNFHPCFLRYGWDTVAIFVEVGDKSLESAYGNRLLGVFEFQANSALLLALNLLWTYSAANGGQK